MHNCTCHCLQSEMDSKYFVIGVPILLFFTLIMVNNNWRLGPLSGLSAADLESIHKKADFAEKVGVYSFWDKGLQPSEFDLDIEVLIIVLTTAETFTTRNFYRDTIVKSLKNKDLKYKLIFLFGMRDSNEKIHDDIEFENEIHRDLVLPMVQDSYQTAALKLLSSFYWISQIPKQNKLKWIVKIDDDVLLNVKKFNTYVETILFTEKTSSIYGQVYYGTPPMRSGKWEVSYMEYPNDTYPDYCIGPIYMMSPKTSEKLLLKFEDSSSFLWVEDVYLTGVLPEMMNIPRIAFGSNIFIVGEPKDTTYMAAKVNEIDAGIINSWKELHYKT